MNIGLVLLWWLAVSLFGWAAVGLAWRLFPNAKDRGWGISRILGLLLASYICWLLASFHILPFSRASIGLSILMVAALSALLIKSQLPDFIRFLKGNITPILVTEALFFFSVLIYGWLRSWMPDIAGTEKFPDLAFLSSIIRSDYFPPTDPWFVGEPINYFYFGHLQVAVLAKLTGIAPIIAFNLAIVLLFAFTVAGSFCLAYTLTGKLLFAFLGPVFVAIMGNLDSLYQFIAKPEGEWNDLGQGFNWWMPSRVIIKKVLRDGNWVTIDETINEFPYWSFLLGDLHAHLLAVPLMFCNLLHLFELASKRVFGWRVFGTGWGAGVAFAVTAICLGAIPPTNFWEVPTFALLAAAAVFAGQIRSFGKPSLLAVPGALAILGSLFLGAIVAFFPFHHNFLPQASKIMTLPWEHFTGFWHFIDIYGFFLFMMACYLLPEHWLLAKQRDLRLFWGATGAISLVTLAVTGSLPIAILLLLIAAFALLLWFYQERRRVELFAIIVTIGALGLVLGCEFVYIKDFYSDHLCRMNTIFKFYFQAWIFLGLTCAYFTARVFEKFFQSLVIQLKQLYLLLFFGLLLGSLVFTFAGPNAKTGGFVAGPQSHIPTLNGIAYMSWRFPDDFGAINWLNANVKGQPVLLEATGEAFSHYSRISACTGLPTILGWGNHESLWRDQTWKTITARTQEVEKIYKTATIQEAMPLLQKYLVKYIFVGHLEKERYKDGNLQKFDQAFRVVHEEGGGKLYEVSGI